MFQIGATQRLKGEDAPSRARKLVQANDVLFATIRPTLQRIAIVPEHLDKQGRRTGQWATRRAQARQGSPRIEAAVAPHGGQPAQ